MPRKSDEPVRNRVIVLRKGMRAKAGKVKGDKMRRWSRITSQYPLCDLVGKKGKIIKRERNEKKKSLRVFALFQRCSLKGRENRGPADDMR